MTLIHASALLIIRKIFFLVVVLILESKGLYSYFDFGGDRCFKTRVLRVSSPLML